MKFRMVITNLSLKERSYLIKQYEGRDCFLQTNLDNCLVIEAEDSFERVMVLMAVGMMVSNYSVTLVSQGGEKNVKEEAEEDTS